MLQYCVIFLILTKFVYAPPLLSAQFSDENVIDFWVFRLIYNLFGYATMAIPAYFIIQYLQKVKYNETGMYLCICFIFIYFY